MIRRIFSFAIIIALISSCANSGKKDVSSKTDATEKSVRVEFAELIANPYNYVGRNIIVEGKVVHVCTETGKKMFVVGENPDVRLYVAAGETISKFPMELLGSEIAVEGLITKVGETVPAATEKEGKAMDSMKPGEGAAKTMGNDSCETETALKGQTSMANIVMQYKSHTVKQVQKNI
jgi:hypothetical protein